MTAARSWGSARVVDRTAAPTGRRRLSQRRAPAGSASAHGRCEARGCLAGTTERKPFCLEHLDRLPYVAWLLGEETRREAAYRAEFEGALAGVPPPRDGEIVGRLRAYFAAESTLSVRRLRQALRIESGGHGVVTRLAKVLGAAGILEIETWKLNGREHVEIRRLA